ncbi:alpha/beta hydrolase [Agromyces mariniharenae]|uniref:Alpha/beta hydrolase n=1 Tax=Agromyces mariniharenae TaxID=2604423 RepID=A0A5S4UWR6_9MICO|nr:alpha/beta hydrolase [Agromyces mariniharenae]
MTRDRGLLGLGGLLAAVALTTGGCTAGTVDGTGTAPPSPRPEADFTGTVDIGGREMYLECTGQGAPTVILVSGGGIAGDVWDSPLGERPTVQPTIGEETRVCSYDRPGTTRAQAEGGVSRSDPVPQPVTPRDSVADLHALLEASGQAPPYVLAAHSYGGLVARYYANQYPDDVAGMVLVDSFSPELREAMPEAWSAWLAWNAASPEIVADYPDYEQVAFDEALDQVAAARELQPMPLVVLTADEPYPAPTKPGLPADLNTVTREAQDVSQRLVAELVPGALHVTETHSGHDIMLENPVLVSDSILAVVDAVRAGRTAMN